eukprot:gene19297-25157_t
MTIISTDGKLFDVIVLGASGKLGAAICKYLNSLETNIKWAISGPYKLLGQDVIETCISTYSHYIDLSTDPYFHETSFLTNYDLAKEKGVLIIHACSFEAAINDFGCIFAMKQYPNKMCSSIESFLRLYNRETSNIYINTIDTTIYDSKALSKIRKEIDIKYNPPKKLSVGPKLKCKSSYYFDKRLRQYAVPSNGSDLAVIKSTFRSLTMLEGENVWPQCASYVIVDNIYKFASTTLYGSLINIFTGLAISQTPLTPPSPTNKLIGDPYFEMHFYAKGYSQVDEESEIDRIGGVIGTKEYARSMPLLTPSDLQETAVVTQPCALLFGSKKHATKSNISEMKPLDREVHFTISGPEPNYNATPIIVITLALCLLQERENLPIGGVFTPSAAFRRSDTIIDRLDRAGLQFNILESLNRPDEAEEDSDEVFVTSVEGMEYNTPRSTNSNEDMKLNDNYNNPTKLSVK